MKVGDKVKALVSPYEIFEIGKVYTVGYVDERPYGVYLIDPFYEQNGLDDNGCFKSWPFHRDELELVEKA